MRAFKDSLTILAALIAVALIALMVVPRFMDWNQQRMRVADYLTRALGVEVAINGALSLSILPQPSLEAEDIRFGPAGAPLFTATRLGVTLAPLALLSSAVHLTSLDAEGSEILAAPLLALFAQAPRDSRLAKAGVERLSLKAVRIRLPERLDGLVLTGDMSGAAPSLLGPFTLAFDDKDGERGFHAQIGRFDNGRARLKGVLEARRFGLRAALDGWLGVEGQPLYDGALQLNGSPLPDAAPVPFELGARVMVAADQLMLDPVTLTLGEGDAATQINGRGFANLASPRPLLALEARARRFEPAALFGKGAALPVIEDVLPRFKALDGLSLPFDLSLTADTEAIQLPGGLMQGVHIELRKTPHGLALDALSMRLPGETRLSFMREAADPAFLDGRTMIESQSPAIFLGWLRGKAEVNSGAAAGRLTLSSRLRQSKQGLQLDDMLITSEAGELKGTGRFEPPVPGLRNEPHLALDLAAPRFDARVLAALEPLHPLQGLSLSTTLAIASLQVDGKALGGLSAMVERDGEAAHLRRLRLTGPSGEELTLSGSASPEAVQLIGKLDAERLEDIAALMKAVFPGALSEGFSKRARLLAPALAVANISLGMKNGAAIWEIALDGKLGGTSLNAQSRSDAKDGAISLDATLDHPDAARLLAQLTGQVPQDTRQSESATMRAAQAPGQIILRLVGNPRRSVKLALKAAFAATSLDLDGEVMPFRLTNPFDGRLVIKTPDLAALQKALGGGAPLVSSPTAGRLEAQLLGTPSKITLTGLSAQANGFDAEGEIAFDLSRNGQIAGQITLKDIPFQSLLSPVFGALPKVLNGLDWPDTPFPPAIPPMLAGDLFIKGERLTLTPGVILGHPQTILRFAPGLIAVEGFNATLGDARLDADLALDRKDETISLAGKIGFSRVPLAVLSGHISGEMPLSAQGASLFKLMQGLGGAGRVSITGVMIPEADPRVLQEIVDTPLDRLAPINDNTVGARIEAGLKAGPLMLPPLTLPATLNMGQMRLGGMLVNPETPFRTYIGITPTLLYDIAKGQLDARLTLRLTAPPKVWRGATPEITLLWAGRPGMEKSGIRRGLQVSPLVNGLLALSIERDLERAEAFDADIRERMFFNRRLKAGGLFAPVMPPETAPPQ